MITLRSLLLLLHLAFVSAVNTPDGDAAVVARVYREVQTKFEGVRAGFCAICTPLCRIVQSPDYVQAVFDEIDRYTAQEPALFQISPKLSARVDEKERKNLRDEVNRLLRKLDEVRRERYPEDSYIPPENCQTDCGRLVTGELMGLARDQETEFREDGLLIDLAAAQLLTKHIRSEDNMFTCAENVQGRPTARMPAIDEILASILGRIVRCMESNESEGRGPAS